VEHFIKELEDLEISYNASEKCKRAKNSRYAINPLRSK
jgi:predicted DNA-binding protein